jgi:isopenicillin N synthase-like dioxygenase
MIIDMAAVESQSSEISPFPDNVPVAPLVTISLSKLLQGDENEHAELFQAAKSLGFFYLDMRGCPEGETLLQQANAMFDLAQDFFALPEEEKKKYDFAAQGKYFGYKGLGKEVIDGKGTKDRNEIYNVGDTIPSVGELLVYCGY